MTTIGTHRDVIASYSLELVAESPGGTKQKAARRISRAIRALAGGPDPTFLIQEPACSQPDPCRCVSRKSTRVSTAATSARCCRTFEPKHVLVHLLPMNTLRWACPFGAVQAEDGTRKSGDE